MTAKLRTKGSVKAKPKPKNSIDPRNKLNDLSGKEWLQLSRSWWYQKGLGRDHKETKIERQHPAPFSYRDVQKIILMLTKPGMLILDPFCGVASTLKAAGLSGRNAIGFEVSTRWARLGKMRLDSEVPKRKKIGLSLTVIRGDCLRLLPKLEDQSIDLILTSPPYWGILNKDPDHKVKAARIANGLATHYSSSPSDLANIETYREFLKKMESVIRQCRRVLKDQRYMVMIVGDFRHGAEYVPYHMHIAQLAEDVGLHLAGTLILVQDNKQLYPYGYPFAYVPNIHHQYALIFRR
jgi:DNA modification methylase